MPLEAFETLTLKISPHTKLVALHLLGDPLSLPNLQDYLQIAQKSNLKLEITTSGFYLAKQIPLLLETPCIHQINISLASLLYQTKKLKNPSNAAFLPKDCENLEEYLDNIFKLCHLHQQTKSEKFINLRLWNLNPDFSMPKQNQALLDRLTQYFHTPINPPKTRLAYKIHLLMQPFFSWVNLKSPLFNQPLFCYGASKQLGILCQGEVVPCCFDTQGVIRLGNIFSNSLNDILSNPRTKALLQGFKNHQYTEELCRHCTYPAFIGKNLPVN